MVHVVGKGLFALQVATAYRASIILRRVFKQSSAERAPMNGSHTAEFTETGGAGELLETRHEEAVDEEAVEVVRVAVGRVL